jgi:lipoyl(octanoyl) transferase
MRGRRDADLTAWWLGRVPYREAWDLQHRLMLARREGAVGDQLLLLEHEPVLTLGRRGDPAHVRAARGELAARGIEVIQVERGGDVTYHGPGQLTAYPIVGLAERRLGVRPFVRALEEAMSATCAAMGVAAGPLEAQPGCWCGGRRKIGAIGIRVERGIGYHGLALNVSVRLSDFDLIDACGMAAVESTSIDREMGRLAEPSTESVARAAAELAPALGRALGAPIAGLPSPDAAPSLERRRLEAMLATPSALLVGAR